MYKPRIYYFEFVSDILTSEGITAYIYLNAAVFSNYIILLLSSLFYHLKRETSKMA